MKTRDFFFDLPQDLIAQRPVEKRGDSRLMVFDRARDEIVHASVADLPDVLPKESCLVFNNSRVRKARIFAESPSGGAYEFLLVERDKENPDIWSCVVNKAARLKLGKELVLPESIKATIVGDLPESGAADRGRRLIKFSPPLTESWIQRNGHVPLPPYIRRTDDMVDEDRYQTVYAGPLGSVAAPTAGLHFTESSMNRLRDASFSFAYLTLHVGLGTFLPVRTEEVESHIMHREYYSIPPETSHIINECKQAGKKCVAVGTTSLRTLESATNDKGILVPGEGNTDIFIYPGYSFCIVDALFTNFHTPESTLLMLVSAFAGTERIKRVYRIAVEKKYRFFSYGDAMLIL